MFYISFIAVFLYGIGVSKSTQRNKYFCVISGIVYFMLAALRSSSVGVDTPGYVKNLLYLGEIPLSRVAMIREKDICFYWLLSILGKFTDSYTILFIIVAGWFGYSVWHFIHKYSPDVALSVILLLSLNLYQFSLTAMRQAIAMAFVVWGFDMILQKKYLKASIWILLGSLFHLSAMVVLILIPINIFAKKITRRRALVICGLLALLFLLRTSVAKELISYLEDRDYSLENENTGMTMTFVIFILLVMMSLFMNGFSTKNKHAPFFFLCGSIACGFQMLVATQPIFFRFGFYFLMVYPIMIPLVIDSLRIRNNYRIMKYSLYVLMSVQYLMFTINSCGISPYQFFWESV